MHYSVVIVLGLVISKQRGDSPSPEDFSAGAEHPGSSLNPLGTSPWVSSWKQGLALKLLFAALEIGKRRTGGRGDECEHSCVEFS